MSKTKITITYDGNHMDIETENCSVLDRVLGSAMLIKSIAESLNITTSSTFGIVKKSLEAEEEGNLQKGFEVMSWLNEFEKKVNECSAEQ